MADPTAGQCRKWLVTGAGGFVGGAVMRGLAGAGREVVAVTRRPAGTAEGIEQVVADLRDGLPDRADFAGGTVIHAAARMGGASLAELWPDNIEATRLLLEWCVRNRAAHFVFISSGGVYPYAEGLYHDEEERELPIGHYGHSKLIGEQLCRAFSAECGLQVTVLRLFFPYGSSQTRGIVPFIAAAVRDGRPLTINARGAPYINPIHIEDVVRAVLAIADADEGCRTVNVCGDEVLSFLDIVRLCERRYGQAARLVHGDADPGDLLGRNERLRVTAEWAPRHRLAAFIERLP